MSTQLPRSKTILACLMLLLHIGQANAQQPEINRWMINVYGTGVLFPNTSAKISLGGQSVPNASVNKPADATVTFDIGYFVLPDLAVDLYAGIPPKGAVIGTGPIRPLGTLATTWYGPAVLAVQYFIPRAGSFHPYVGAGVNYTMFLRSRGAALQNVKISNAFGTALEAGLQYEVAPRWTLNMDIKYIALSTRISATYPTPFGDVPAVAKTEINPLTVSFGIGYRF